MKNFVYALVGCGLIFVVGCDKGTSTAISTQPSTDPNKPNPARKLTVTSPGSQTVKQDQTDKFTVTISRSHFDTPVVIELQNLPTGVSVDSKDLTIPSGKTSAEVTIKAAPDAAPTDKHKVTVVAKTKDMPEDKVEFELTVKAK